MKFNPDVLQAHINSMKGMVERGDEPLPWAYAQSEKQSAFYLVGGDGLDTAESRGMMMATLGGLFGFDYGQPGCVAYASDTWVTQHKEIPIPQTGPFSLDTPTGILPPSEDPKRTEALCIVVAEDLPNEISPDTSYRLIMLPYQRHYASGRPSQFPEADQTIEWLPQEDGGGSTAPLVSAFIVTARFMAEHKDDPMVKAAVAHARAGVLPL